MLRARPRRACDRAGNSGLGYRGTRSRAAAETRTSAKSLRDDRRRCFDRRRGFALADVYGIFAPVTRPGPHRSVIVIGLGRIKIARIKSDAVGRSQFWMIDVTDMTATRPAFGSLYAWTQVGGPRTTRQQTSCGRENKCCDERLGDNPISPTGAPSDATLLAKLGHNLQTCNRLKADCGEDGDLLAPYLKT
jgi:hypothetical protein